MLKRGRKNAAMERLSSLTNILAIRWRGFDPERILNFLDRWFWWVFTPTAVVIVLIAAMVALLSVLIHFEAFQSRLPGFDQFFDPRRWIMFAGVSGGYQNAARIRAWFVVQTVWGGNAMKSGSCCWS